MGHRVVFLLACFALFVGCGGGGSVEIPTIDIPVIPQVPNTTLTQTQVDTSQTVLPDAEEPTDTILLQILTECLLNMPATEQFIATNAQLSDRHQDVTRWSLEVYRRVIRTDSRLIGRDMPVRFVGLGDSPDLSGSVINVYGVTDVVGSNLPTFNAFALRNAVLVYDRLFDAFAEGAAYYDALLELAGGDEDNVDLNYLVLGLGTIFLANHNGQFGTVVPEAEVWNRIDNNPVAFEAYWGAVAFVVFHELGHANLEHGLFKCLIERGIEQALIDAGITPTPQEQVELELAIAKIDRGTETQADIYAATILERAGFSTNGPAIFVVGFLSLKLVAGSCDPMLPDESAFEACLLDSAPENDHPPLDVRADVIERCIEQHQDLTGMLDILQALHIG